jgi:3-oxoacyl-[acyl-carrier protein] reductase
MSETLQNNFLSKLDFSGRIALVTGASKGIGRAIVMGLASQGASVLFTYRTQDDSVKTLEAWAKENGAKVRSLQCDHVKESACDILRSAIEKGDGLDILINNVGDVLRRSSFEDSDDRLWEDAINVNVLSMVRSIRTSLPFLKKSGRACIVNVSSIAGISGGGGDSLHYATSKGAVNTFTKGLAKELTKIGIRVIGVAPSAIDTDFQTKHSSSERIERIVAGTPIGRIGTAEEVADVVVYLASNAASYISGETIRIAGGR